MDPMMAAFSVGVVIESSKLGFHFSFTVTPSHCGCPSACPFAECLVLRERISNQPISCRSESSIVRLL
jgi:hypothetical protein